MVVLIGVAIVVVTLVVSRGARERSRSRARTVELTIDSTGVNRVLADGRAEGAVWSELIEIELVHTPVRTADGARAFVVLAESDERGCLVPLDVGYDQYLLVEMSRLPGFDIRRFEQVLAEVKNGRTTIWSRQAPTGQAPTGQDGAGDAGADGVVDGANTDGTGSSE